ncbi:MAG: CgeB family protein [Pseudomonadales bacterium]
MNFALFYHSVRSDWNHGNAHFLRGVVRALQARGHQAVVYEPEDGWSWRQLREDQGPRALARFNARFPDIRWQTYRTDSIDLDALLDGVDVVIAHEWNDPALLSALSRYRTHGGGRGGLRLLFHDTHHRMVSEPETMEQLDLTGFDGVLAFGAVLADAYRRAGWGRSVFTWHEAADVSTFFPLPANPVEDVVWIGNWGDGERERELSDYLIEPVRQTGARLGVHGVRYPQSALQALTAVGADYRGWIAGPDVAAAFARARLTVHVPRRWYRERLVGIPTIRVFEALACGIALISAPWEDVEGLFAAGDEYYLATDPDEMVQHMRRLLCDDDERREVSRNGLRRILTRHTCLHRVMELERVLQRLGAGATAERLAI